MSYDLSVSWRDESSVIPSDAIIDFFKENGLAIKLPPSMYPEFDLLETSGCFPILLEQGSKLLDGRFDEDLVTCNELFPSEPEQEIDDDTSEWEKEELELPGTSISMHYGLPKSDKEVYSMPNCVEFMVGFLFAGAIINSFDGFITDPQTCERFRKEDLGRYIDGVIAKFNSDIGNLTSEEIDMLTNFETF